MKRTIDKSPSRHQVLRLVAMVTASAVSPKALSAAETLTGDADNADVPANGVPTFESVWQTVRDRFYDPRHNGLDWSAARERYLPDVQRATSHSSLASVINTMLSELHASTRASIRRMSRNTINLQISLPAHCDAADCSVRFRTAAFHTLG